MRVKFGIYLLIILVKAYSSYADDLKTVDGNSIIRCYACGLKSADPEIDVTGSYGDSRRNWTLPGKKMYNHSCDIMNDMGPDEKWVRNCPVGVRSCFWSQGRHNTESAIFRGCASAKYKHNTQCDRELQAVQLKRGQRSKDVEVLLCFCSEDHCNFKISLGHRVTLSTFILVMCLAFIFSNDKSVT